MPRHACCWLQRDSVKLFVETRHGLEGLKGGSRGCMLCLLRQAGGRAGGRAAGRAAARRRCCCCTAAAAAVSARVWLACLLLDRQKHTRS